MRHRSFVWQQLRDEQGSIAALSTVMISVLTVIILPLVWNLGAIHVTRRQSQNTSDAAALAGAETVARRINAQSLDVWSCDPPLAPPLIVKKYIATVVTPIANSNAGRGAADSYARSNRGWVERYSQRLRPMGFSRDHAPLVDGVVVPPTHVDVGGIVPVRGVLASSLYPVMGRPLTSSATAETYLAEWRRWETPCPGDPYAVAHHYRFRWQVRLVKTGW